MALPLLPLLLLGGAAVVVLASSKSSSSSSAYSKFSKTAEAYTDDSAYICLAVDVDARDTQESLKRKAEAEASEFDGKVRALVDQKKIQKGSIIMAFTTRPSDAAVICSSLSASVAGVPGTATVVQVANMSKVPGGQEALCEGISIISLAVGSSPLSQQDCAALSNPNYAGIGFSLDFEYSPDSLPQMRRFFVRTDGTIEWSQPQVQPSVPPQQTQPTQPIQPSVPPQPPEGLPVRMTHYDKDRNLLAIEVLENINPESNMYMQFSEYTKAAKDFVYSRGGRYEIDAIAMGPVQNILDVVSSDATVIYFDGPKYLPEETLMQVWPIIDQGSKDYGPVDFLATKTIDYPTEEYFLLVHSTGELIPVVV